MHVFDFALAIVYFLLIDCVIKCSRCSILKYYCKFVVVIVLLAFAFAICVVVVFVVIAFTFVNRVVLII